LKYREKRLLEDSRVTHGKQVLIVTSKAVPNTNERSNSGSNSNFSYQVLVDTRLESGSEVVDKTILVSVLFPVVVGVDSSSVLSTFFAISNILNFTKVSTIA
jgi:hypothetical protein